MEKNTHRDSDRACNSWRCSILLYTQTQAVTQAQETQAQSQTQSPSTQPQIEAPQQPPQTEVPTQPVGNMVWLSATGSKYHSRNNCGNMNPANAYQVTESDAINQGYGKCKKCW